MTRVSSKSSFRPASEYASRNTYSSFVRVGVCKYTLRESFKNPMSVSFYPVRRAPLALQLMLTSGLSQPALLQLGRCDITAIPQRCIESLQKQATGSPAVSLITKPVNQPAAAPRSAAPEVTSAAGPAHPATAVAAPAAQPAAAPAPAVQAPSGAAGVTSSAVVMTVAVALFSVIAVLL